MQPQQLFCAKALEAESKYIEIANVPNCITKRCLNSLM